ncbi:MAG: hypothetical protein QF535_02280 [Anaerolineales bacterium]|jgi:hypothetical protein|nr:hypothetical protein [Anaerolineales bacterium]|tara:strand:+ start:236 stop:1012 length:777 start_codon:yes stop_codon:yes gene_type:complete
MAYFTGRDVSVWVVTEHAADGIARTDAANGTDPYDRLKVYEDVHTVSTGKGTAGIIGSLGNAGEPNWQISDLTALDVTIGAQDEDISYIGLRNIGKIEVKKDTSISLTRKKGDNDLSLLFQGKTKSDDSPTADGLHSGRAGLIANAGGTAMLIADGTVDPKSSTDDGDGQCFGFRVFVELKAATGTDGANGDGEVLVVPNCQMMEYGHTLANESANEETLTLTSQVKPFIVNGTKEGGANGNVIFVSPARTQTTSANM